MSLIVLGTVALDDVTAAGKTKKKMLGGSGSHFCMSSRLFTKTHLVSIVGRDFPRKHLSMLKQKGIDVSSLLLRDGKTFAWQGEYDASDLNQAITKGTELGVLMSYDPVVSPAQAKIANVFLANFDPVIQMKFLKQMKNPKFVGLDTMNLWIANMRKDLTKLVKKVDLFILNDAEAKQYTGETNVIKAARAIRKLGPKIVVIKKGEHGVFIDAGRFMFAFSAYPVDSVLDPTGAGDTFAGGLMGYLSKSGRATEKVMRQAALYATALSSFNVQGFGNAKTANLTLPKVHQRMKALVKFITP